MDMKTGWIYDIKRYAINDGPGIRTTVFLKGCPLRCAWCHNPEGISPAPHRVYSPSKCIGCRMCIAACPEQALTMTENGVSVDDRRCLTCGICAATCPSTATEIFGYTISVENLLREVEKDSIFFDQSGGGVTFSGGEPLLQADFLEAALNALGQRSIHRVVDTTGHAATGTLLRVAAHTDLFLYDLKLMDSARHKRWTGVVNGLILKNLRCLAESGACYWVRIPLIAGVNADVDNLRKTADFLFSLPGNVPHVNLLPFHNMMANKYAKLGETFHGAGTMTEPDEALIRSAVEIFARKGIEAIVGG